LTNDGLRRRRVAAQLLHRGGRMSPAGVVRHLVGVQAQVLSAAGLAFRARTRGLTIGSVERARIGDRSIVLTWAMRGTLHLVASEDYNLLVPLVTEPRKANSHRRLKQEGVPSDLAERAIGLIARMLEREGPLTRSEIAQRLSRRGIRTEGQAIAHLAWLAAVERGICFGPDRDGERTFVLVRDWIDAPASPDPDTVLGDLVLRYLRSHGPAAPMDLAAWSGIRLSDAKRAWKAIGHRLVEVGTPSGPLWSRRSLDDEAPRGGVRLIPSFDEYLLGWKDRGFAVPSEWKERINRGGGWVHPVVLVDGRAVGSWSMQPEPNRLRLVVLSFSPSTPALRRGVAAEAEDVASFLETPVELEFV
jgi:hypothetical protein